MKRTIESLIACMLLAATIASTAAATTVSNKPQNRRAKIQKQINKNNLEPNVAITIHPYNPTIIIPEPGGIFKYAIEVSNDKAASSTFDIWTTYTLQGGTPSGPQYGPARFELPGGWSANHEDLSQEIMGSMSPGVYTYTANVGLYPGEIWDSDSFSFTKLSETIGWYAQMPGVDRSINGVSFSDTENGWAVGPYYTIIHTTNGGDTWYPQDDGQYYIQNYNDVFFVNDQVGWVIGSKILHTTDGGNTWIEQYEPSLNGLYDGFFVDENNGWVVGGIFDSYNELFHRIILHTSDGGATWNTQLSQSGYYYDPVGPLNGIYFIDINHGWAVGDYGAIFETSDGGVNWNEQDAGTNNELYGVAFTNLNNGWAVGEDGTLLFTTDGGAVWNSFDLGTGDDLNSIVFSDENNGWMVGSGFYPVHGSIFHTVDGGLTWELQDRGTGEDEYLLHDICFVDEYSGWAAGGSAFHDRGVMLHTENGGGSSVYPALSYTPSSIDFGEMYGAQLQSTVVTVQNGGTGSLWYYFSEQSEYLTIEPEGGFSSGEQDVITVTIDTLGLQPGGYHWDITVYSNAGTDVIPVDVTIIEGNQVLSYLPTRLDFGDMQQYKLKTMDLDIWNSGTGTMFYWVDDSGTFCVVEPWSGSSQGEVNTHTVSCFTSGLGFGLNQCNLIIHSNGGNAVVPVSVNVIP